MDFRLMLKVEGSNPVGSIFFANFANYMTVRGQERWKSREFHATSPLAGVTCSQHMITHGRYTAINRWTMKSFVSTSLAEVPRNMFGGQDCPIKNHGTSLALDQFRWISSYIVLYCNCLSIIVFKKIRAVAVRSIHEKRERKKRLFCHLQSKKKNIVINFS